MRWMLGGGLVVLGLIGVGLVIAWKSGDGGVTSEAPQVPEVTQVPATAVAIAEAELSPLMQRSEPSILAEAEPLARRFLEANTIDELLPVVYQPQRAKPRMQRTYPSGRIEPAGLAQFNVKGSVVMSEKLAIVDIRTRDFASRQLTFVETPEGLKIDWESWAGWSDMTWSELLASLPTQATLFRVIVKRVEYYNFGFSDDKKWQSYRLESPDGERMIFAYVERGSPLEEKLRISPDADRAAMILKIKFPAGVAASNNQVVVDAWVADGWVEPDA